MRIVHLPARESAYQLDVPLNVLVEKAKRGCNALSLGSNMQAGGKMLALVCVNCEMVDLRINASSARVLCLLPESGLECGLLYQLRGSAQEVLNIVPVSRTSKFAMDCSIMYQKCTQKSLVLPSSS